jgi:AraC-like DNA-binding protein
MSNDSAAPFLELPYRNPSFPGLGIEAFRLSELRSRVSPEHYERVQRLHFNMLMLFIEGHGRQEVDFVRVECRPGVVLHVQPGQVQRWLSIEAVEAHLVLFAPAFLFPSSDAGSDGIDRGRLDQAESPMSLALESEAFDEVRHGFEAIAKEYRRTDGGKVSEAILRHLLSALLLQLGREAEKHHRTTPPLHDAIFRHFRREVEASFTRTRAVAAYAHRIGCSTKTLTRATQAATGLSPKQFIDARVTLEAKRLLAHTSMSVGEMAHVLGFSEATNFAKHFRRETGTFPSAFRDAVQA